MALFKMIDGVNIEMTPEEEVVELARWKVDMASREADLARNGHHYGRKAEMPSTYDLLQMLWGDMDSGKVAQAPAFYAAIKAVNDKYPKPE